MPLRCAQRLLSAADLSAGAKVRCDTASHKGPHPLCQKGWRGHGQETMATLIETDLSRDRDDRRTKESHVPSLPDGRGGYTRGSTPLCSNSSLEKPAQVRLIYKVSIPIAVATTACQQQHNSKRQKWDTSIWLSHFSIGEFISGEFPTHAHLSWIPLFIAYMVKSPCN